MTVEPLHAILRAKNPRIALTPDLPLGADGLGLDSISLVEVLLACEETFGIDLAAELLAGKPLTVGALTEAIEARRQG